MSTNMRVEAALTEQVLTAMINGDLKTVEKKWRKLVKKHNAPGLAMAAYCWATTINLLHPPCSCDHPGDCEPQVILGAMNSRGERIEIDEAPQVIRDAGRLVAAGIALDNQNFLALAAAVPPDEFANTMWHVLEMVAQVHRA